MEFIFIFDQPLQKSSHLAGVNTSKTLEDKVMEVCGENMIKTAHYNQCRYDSFEYRDNKDEFNLNIRWW